MTRDLPDADALVRALQQKGWQPARSDVEPLFALVATGDKDAAEAASRALARLGLDAARAAIARFDAAPPVARARLVRLVGRVARGDRALAQFLVAHVADADEKTARNAALALGKLGELVPAAEVERALHAAVDPEHSADTARVAVQYAAAVARHMFTQATWTALRAHRVARATETP